MTDEEKNEFLYDLYYKKKMQVGRDSLFYHISKTLKNEDISRRYIADWLSRQESQQLYTNKKKQTSIRPILSNRPGAIIQIDLIDFSNKPSNGYRYILNVIDVFSRKVWLNEIKNKTRKDVIDALNNIIIDIQKDHVIRVIQSDNGGEFNIKIGNIKLIKARAYTPQNQGFVERSNGTVKKILNRIMSSEKTSKWDEYLNDVEETYNAAYNSTIKMSPDTAYSLDKEKTQELYERLKASKGQGFKEVNTVLSVNDNVRVIIEKKGKKGEPNWTKEIYKVRKVIKGNVNKNTIDRYKIEDSNGILMRNTYQLSKLLYIPEVLKKKEGEDLPMNLPVR